MNIDATVRTRRVYCVWNTFGINRTGEFGRHEWNYSRFSFLFTSMSIRHSRIYGQWNSDGVIVLFDIAAILNVNQNVYFRMKVVGISLAYFQYANPISIDLPSKSNGHQLIRSTQNRIQYGSVQIRAFLLPISFRLDSYTYVCALSCVVYCCFITQVWNVVRCNNQTSETNGNVRFHPTKWKYARAAIHTLRWRNRDVYLGIW